MKEIPFLTQHGLDLIEMGQEGLERFKHGDVTKLTTDDMQFALISFECQVKKGATLCRVGDALNYFSGCLRAVMRGQEVERHSSNRLGSQTAEAA